MEIEDKMEQYLKPLFGDMAPMTIQMQKDRLELQGELSKEDYAEIIKSIHHLCQEMAGDVIAEKIKMGLLEIVESEN